MPEWGLKVDDFARVKQLFFFVKLSDNFNAGTTAV